MASTSVTQLVALLRRAGLFRKRHPWRLAFEFVIVFMVWMMFGQAPVHNPASAQPAGMYPSLGGLCGISRARNGTYSLGPPVYPVAAAGAVSFAGLFETLRWHYGPRIVRAKGIPGRTSNRRVRLIRCEAEWLMAVRVCGAG